MNQSHWVLIANVASAMWPVLTGLVGVLIGAYISNRNQRKHWVADNKRAEYRELLTTMTRTFNTVIILVGPGVALAGNEQRKLIDADSECSIVIKDRIFIADEVDEMDLLKRWHEARQHYGQTYDVGEFASSFGRIMGDLRVSAREIIR